jgi:hypothetical protein
VLGTRPSVLCLILASAALAAAVTRSAAAAPPPHPKSNPLFAAEWWLRGPPWILQRPGTMLPLRAAASPPVAGTGSALALARQIGAGVDARYPGLRVSETSSTAVIESLTLFGADEPRVVPADRGIYYAVCPNRATCPYPGRAARPPTALAPRRVALELALRTFLETSADLVVVSLPARRFILLVLERNAIEPQSVSESLAPYAPVDRSLQLHALVDGETLAHLYVPLALAPTASGRDSLFAWPLGLGP